MTVEKNLNGEIKNQCAYLQSADTVFNTPYKFLQNKASSLKHLM
jgi:hypothetical protein